MAEQPWVPFYFADYLADTSRLSLAEHGAYLLLMAEAYRNDGRIDFERGDDTSERHAILYRICRCESDKDRTAVDRVLGQFFTKSRDSYTHGRISKELAKAADRKAKSQKAATTRWEERASSEHMPEPCSKDAPYNHSHSYTHNHESQPEPEPQPHTHTTRARADDPPIPIRTGKPPIAKTDAELLPFFEAFREGAGQLGLQWGSKYWRIAEMIRNHGKPPDRIKAVAAFYRSKCDKGTPKLANFAADIDRWDSECGFVASSGRPHVKTPDEWIAEGRCPKHPGEDITARACELCEAIEGFNARQTA